MTQQEDSPTPETTTADDTSDRGDTVSDPGMESGSSTDWSSEGGAVEEGPATDVADGDQDDEHKPGEDDEGLDQPGNPTDPSSPTG